MTLIACIAGKNRVRLHWSTAAPQQKRALGSERFRAQVEALAQRAASRRIR